RAWSSAACPPLGEVHRHAGRVRRSRTGARSGGRGSVRDRDRGVVRQSPLRRSRRRTDPRRHRAGDRRATGDGGLGRFDMTAAARAVFARSTWIVAAVVVAFHLATATIYGYHRDEFYYLASGRRLAWGYVDHPPLTPFLYRVS